MIGPSPLRLTELVAPSRSPSDDGLLVAAALRDRHAYAGLVRRYEPVLGRYVRRLLGRHGQAAEDVLQDVFIKAYLNLNDYDRSRPFAPWIYRITHNEAISYLRKQRAGVQTVDGEDALLILERIAGDDDPEGSLQRSRADDDVRKALTALDPRYRDVLVLRYLEEKSYDEIADILEMPMGTVATFINRGLKQLTRSLRNPWGASDK
jgi:RNA polymerase sigma-70 factor, ECF subfamily